MNTHPIVAEDTEAYTAFEAGVDSTCHSCQSEGVASELQSCVYLWNRTWGIHLNLLHVPHDQLICSLPAAQVVADVRAVISYPTSVDALSERVAPYPSRNPGQTQTLTLVL